MEVPAQVDRLADRTGMAPQAVAVILIVAGLLIIAFPALIAWIVGVTMVVAGAWWLYASFEERRARRETPPRTSPPP